MLSWTALDQIPADLGSTVVTLGNFDGVHRGHRVVLGELVDQARAAGLPSVVVTFDPHPLTVLFPDRAPEPLASVGQRETLLASVGVDAVFLMPFTEELARWSPERFVEDIFVKALHARIVVVGADARFGHRNAGDVQVLRDLGRVHGFTVVVLADQGDESAAGQVSEHATADATDAILAPTDLRLPTRWSSTRIRECLSEGRVGEAAALLGRPHRVEGTVVHGAHRGRELGYPTANLSPDAEGMVPADGVYAGWLLRSQDARGRTLPASECLLPAAISVGTNPTFDGERRTVEAYVLDRTDLDLYTEHVVVEFVEHLRPMVRFDSIDALLERMAQDVDRTREVLGVPKRTTA